MELGRKGDSRERASAYVEITQEPHTRRHEACATDLRLSLSDAKEKLHHKKEYGLRSKRVSRHSLDQEAQDNHGNGALHRT